jgi:DNA-directed RNA polymerase alpha subunit
VLAGPLHRLSGNYRFYNLLERNGFAYVEEVAATLENTWFELRTAGPGSSPAVRRVIAELQPDVA